MFTEKLPLLRGARGVLFKFEIQYYYIYRVDFNVHCKPLCKTRITLANFKKSKF